MLAAVQARLLEVVPRAPVRQGFQADVYVSPSAPFQERICTRAPHGQPARLSVGILPQRAGNNLLCWHDFMRAQGTVPFQNIGTLSRRQLHCQHSDVYGSCIAPATAEVRDCSGHLRPIPQ